MSETEQTRKQVELMVCTIVGDSKAVQVDVEATTFRVHVASGDMGRVIGAHGRTARSLRVIVAGAGMKTGAKFSVDIVAEK